MDTFTCKNEIFWKDDNSPEQIGRLIISDLLSRKDFMYYNVDDVHSIHYA